MTLLSFSLSTMGIWVEVLDIQLGLQFRHSNYEAPYIHFNFILGSVTVSLHHIQVKWICDWHSPRIYMTVWEWPKPQGVTIKLDYKE